VPSLSEILNTPLATDVRVLTWRTSYCGQQLLQVVDSTAALSCQAAPAQLSSNLQRRDSLTFTSIIIIIIIIIMFIYWQADKLQLNASYNTELVWRVVNGLRLHICFSDHCNSLLLLLVPSPSLHLPRGTHCLWTLDLLTALLVLNIDSNLNFHIYSCQAVQHYNSASIYVLVVL